MLVAAHYDADYPEAYQHDRPYSGFGAEALGEREDLFGVPRCDHDLFDWVLVSCRRIIGATDITSRIEIKILDRHCSCCNVMLVTTTIQAAKISL